jgi:NADPH2:quinone reductase
MEAKIFGQLNYDMKAVVISKPGPPEVLEIEEREIPQVKMDEVLIKVYAAGINRPDIMQREGKYPAPAGTVTDIPGLEVSGEIVAVGMLVSRWKVGDKVCALVGGGGYAEFALAHEGSCLPIPKGLSFLEAASLPETIFTVWHNLFERGGLKAGERFLVHGGTSGIGITAIQLAKAWGATVITTASSEEKCKACRDLGADVAINYTTPNFFSSIGDVDIVLDMIGGMYFNEHLDLLNPDGRLVFINAMKGNHADLNIMKIMSKRLTITGSTLRSRSDAFKTDLAKEVENKVWPLIADGKFKPVVYQTFKPENAAKAHRLMESSKHIGKIVLDYTY